FSVHAALPRADAMADWQRTAWERTAVLAVATIGFLALTGFLTRALRQRAAAERDAAAAAERDAAAAEERSARLTEYKAKLEETVAQRTGELREANERLN